MILKEKITCFLKKMMIVYIVFMMIGSAIPTYAYESEENQSREGTVEKDNSDETTMKKDSTVPVYINKSDDQINDESTQEKDSQGTIREETEINEDDLFQYIYVESPYLETLGTQRIVVSLSNYESITSMSLIVKRDTGVKEEWELTRCVDNLYLFEKVFDHSNQKGIYEVVQVNILCQDEIKTYFLSDYDMRVQFGILEEYDGIEELQPIESGEDDVSVAVISADEEQGERLISDALTQANKDVNQKKIQSYATSTISVNQPIVVALDPGHDTTHAGASASGLKEHELTLKIANYCKAELEEYQGVSVYMTRTTAKCPNPSSTTSGSDIHQRADDAFAAGAKIFVSFHINAASSSSASGAEIIVPNNKTKADVAKQGKELAEKILTELVALGLKERSIYSKTDSGSTNDYFAVQRWNKENGIPGIIIEHAFISNSGDVSKFLSTNSGLKKLGVADATGIAEYLGVSKIQGEWKTGDNGEKYYYINDQMVKGAKQISGYWYYFDLDTGVMLTGWRIDGSKKYYYDASGRMLTGAQKIENKSYYFNTDGTMFTGWRTSGSNKYYYDTDGHMVTGAKKIGNYHYYFNSSGVMVKGWRTSGSNKYYYDTSGHMITGAKKISSYNYYFNNNGIMLKGWRTSGSNKYYYDSSGHMVTGAKTISGYKYYFKSNGVMYKGWRTVSKKKYYYDSNGRMSKGVKKISGYLYYFKSDGTLYTKKGWRTTGGKKYYHISTNGRMATGSKKISKYKYYFNPTTGAMTKGWRTSGKNKYYYNSKGYLVTGAKKIGNYYYYFKSNGVMYKGWRTVKKNKYYYDSNGRRVKGTKKIGQYTYYFKSNGQMYKGWRTSGKNKYYYDSKGHMAIGAKTISKAKYYFDSKGIMTKGWRTTKSAKYYYGSNGKMRYGLQKIGSYQYAFNTKTGAMLKNTWYKGKYFGPDGIYVGNTSSSFYKIEGKSTTTVSQMVKYYNKYRGNRTYPTAALSKGGAKDIKTLATIFYEEANREGLKAEVLWVQTMKETGFLTFKGDVVIEQFNFAGLGTTGGGVQGAYFPDVRTGVRAQVQHMKAYVSSTITKETLKTECVDPRFDYISPKGSVQYVEFLGQKENPLGKGWATGRGYGIDIAKKIQLLKKL